MALRPSAPRTGTPPQDLGFGSVETTGQTVHVRTSYKADEVKWGVKFVNIIDRGNPDGIIRVDVTRLDEIEPAVLPTGRLPG